MRARQKSTLLLIALGFTSGVAQGETGKEPAPVTKPAAAPASATPASATPASATSASAAAPVDDPVAAKKLSDEAVELARGGDYTAACAKLEQSLALHDGLGTSFHLAGCWAKIGRTASAYALFDKVATKAHDLGQADREQVARDRMDALLPKLSRVRIDVPSPAPPNTEVKRDEVVLPESDWGKPIPVDRGAHEVHVTAEGKVPWATKLDVSEPGVIVAVQVPALADAPKEEPPKPVPVVAAAPPPKEPTPPPPAADKSKGSGQRTLAIVVGSVGVAALAAGIFKGAEYVDKNNQAKSICPSGSNCTADEIDRHAQAVDDARKARTWAYVGIGVGSAAVAGATVLFFTAPRAPSNNQRATTLRLIPVADGRGTWGGVLRGSF
jgi:hypothetical protein